MNSIRNYNLQKIGLNFFFSVYFRIKKYSKFRNAREFTSFEMLYFQGKFSSLSP